LVADILITPAAGQSIVRLWRNTFSYSNRDSN